MIQAEGVVSPDFSQGEHNECLRLINRQEVMKNTRSNWELNWDETYKFTVPRKFDVQSSRQEGDKRGNELFDSTAEHSCMLLAGAFHSMLTNQTAQFFGLTFGDPELDDDEEVKLWLEETTRTLHAIINGSNFQTEVHEYYIDEIAIGTACMWVDDDEDTTVNFSTRAMKEIYVMENNRGQIDIVHRMFQWDARQIVQEFGEEGLPECVKKKLKEQSSDKFNILHAVEPESDKDVRKVKPIRSTYILPDEKKILRTGYYEEMPCVVARLTKTSGETYGRGYGLSALPETKMVNKMMETTVKGAQMAVFPPLGVTDDGVLGKVKLTPGGLTIVRAGVEKPIQPLLGDTRIDFGYQAVEDARRRIRMMFFIDQLQLQATGPQMTATEVNQRAQQMLRLMGPVLGRQHFEFLRPLVERVFAIAVRKKKIKPAPRKVQGKAFDVRYSSLIAKAQRMSEGASLNQAISVMTPLANAMPSMIDLFNPDRTATFIADTYGVPQLIRNTPREKAQLREAKARAAEQVAREETEAHQAEMVSKMGPTAVQAQAASQQE